MTALLKALPIIVFTQDFPFPLTDISQRKKLTVSAFIAHTPHTQFINLACAKSPCVIIEYVRKIQATYVFHIITHA